MTDTQTKTADVVFEKETAQKTALLLNNTQLGPNHISVTCSGGGAYDDDAQYTKSDDLDSDEISQEEKPRTRILAEYLAHGYVVGEVAIERAIQLDSKHNVSNRFLTTIQNLDQKYHATDRAKATDESYGITQRANSLLTGIGSYFEKASNHPTGKRIVKFYTDSSRQVQDIHAEARRLADLKKQEHGGSAYKAAGLEKVFGKEAPKEATTEAAKGDTKPATEAVKETAKEDSKPATEAAKGDSKPTTKAAEADSKEEIKAPASVPTASASEIAGGTFTLASRPAAARTEAIPATKAHE